MNKQALVEKKMLFGSGSVGGCTHTYVLRNPANDIVHFLLCSRYNEILLCYNKKAIHRFSLQWNTVMLKRGKGWLFSGCNKIESFCPNEKTVTVFLLLQIIKIMCNIAVRGSLIHKIYQYISIYFSISKQVLVFVVSCCIDVILTLSFCDISNGVIWSTKFTLSHWTPEKL